jgi:DNA modification methylase
MKTLEANSVDAIVTDPPYGLEFMGKAWDGFGTPLGFQTWSEQWAREAFRVLKPGGHLLAFGGTRMYHRLAAGIEDAGFEIRDTLMWLYGSGFPKSLDVSKAIDKAAGAEREVVGKSTRHGGGKMSGASFQVSAQIPDITAPSTEAAKKWQGWGTALKPAVEPIVLARKPLIGTVAENVLTHGTGALNIDASRIDGVPPSVPMPELGVKERITYGFGTGTGRNGEMSAASGRWPANILLDEEAAALLDEQSGVSKSGTGEPSGSGGIWNPSTGKPAGPQHGDTGGASRFFYVAKASRSERNAGLDDRGGFAARELFGSDGSSLDGISHSTPTRNIHPTVKPVALMQYLIRLVTPKGGTVLDPFMGSGTTAVAAIQEGVNWIGCEREPEYVAIIEARIAAAQPGMGLNLEEDIK